MVFFENSRENQLKVIRKIRQYQPEVVFCNAIRDRHIDHGRGSSLVSQACFLSGLIKIETLDSEEKPQQTWRPKQVLHYIQWEEIEPQLCLDISDHLDQKMEAVKAYDVAQLVRAPDCGSGGRRFETDLPPQKLQGIAEM